MLAVVVMFNISNAMVGNIYVWKSYEVFWISSGVYTYKKLKLKYCSLDFSLIDNVTLENLWLRLENYLRKYEKFIYVISDF